MIVILISFLLSHTLSSFKNIYYIQYSDLFKKTNKSFGACACALNNLIIRVQYI